VRPHFAHSRALWLALLFTLTTGAPGPARGAPSAGHHASRHEHVLESRVGEATFYGPKRHGRKTASGERMDKNALVAAHPRWPFGSVVRVTNLANGRSVKVRIIDRGPSRRLRREGIIIDLSLAAARALRFAGAGHARVRVDVLKWGRTR
jgi:rare lipoprotein A